MAGNNYCSREGTSQPLKSRLRSYLLRQGGPTQGSAPTNFLPALQHGSADKGGLLQVPVLCPRLPKPARGSCSLRASALSSQPQGSPAAVPALNTAASHHLEQRLTGATIQKTSPNKRGAGSTRAEAPDAAVSSSGNSRDTESEGEEGAESPCACSPVPQPGRPAWKTKCSPTSLPAAGSQGRKEELRHACQLTICCLRGQDRFLLQVFIYKGRTMQTEPRLQIKKKNTWHPFIK